MTHIFKYYEVLGLDTTASAAEVKTAYRSLAKKWHPDRFINVPDRLQQAEQEIQKINEAYEIIKEHIQITIKTDHSPRIKTKKSDANYYYNLGVELAEKEEYNSAIAEFTQAIKLDSQYIKAYQYRGFILSKLGYENRADTDFKKVSQLKFNNRRKTDYYHKQNSNYNNRKKSTQTHSYSSYKSSKNLNSKSCIRTILAHKASVSSVVLSNDNQFLITGSYDKTIKIWQFNTGQIIHTLSGHSKAITCLAINDNNQTIISGSKDSTIRFWDIKQRKIVKTFGGLFSGHSKDIVSLVLDDKNNILISASTDKSIKIWDLGKNKEIKHIDSKLSQVTNLALDRSQGYFCNSGLEKQIRIRNSTTGEVIRSLRGDAAVTALTFSNDGSLLATGEINRKIRILDTNTRKIIKTFVGHTDRISSLIFSSDSKQLISGSWDRSIKIWDIEKEIELETLTSHQDRVLCLATTSNGKIISGSQDSTIKIWQPQYL